LGRLSRDANGERFEAALARDGVDLALTARDPRPSPLAFVMRGSEKTGARYSFYLDATAYDGGLDLPDDWTAGAIHLHAGSIAAIHGAQGAATLEAMRAARGALSVGYDPNVRPMVTPDRDAARAAIEARIRAADFLKASDEDLEWLYPGRAPDESLAELAKAGPKLCVLTRGGKGALGIAGGARTEVAAPAVEVADTVGAGDSFMAALTAAMHADGALGPAFAAPDPATLRRWMSFAARAAAITCSRRGADPPTRAEVEAALRT
ncbi:MAG: carbohydrate kinase, partial [Hyphomicrobiales bacterium]|nr:carbohydrate kinase [Hyphomicrobiales bacterium]